MAIITQTDKRTGITYAYETTYYWDKEKKQSRKKSTIIGKVDPETGKIIPTRGRAKKKIEESVPEAVKPGPAPFSETRHLFYGATYLLEQFSEQLGLTADLRVCFPDHYKQLLSIAFYLILEDNNPLYRFEKWNHTHKHPFGRDIASPRSSELFAGIRDNQVQKFFRLQAKRRVEEEYWAYDSTSISSYSETLNQIQYGKNKEDDKLPQLNLLLVFGEKSGLPFYYRKLAGNIPDSKTVKHLLKELDILGFGKAKFVMDRGFYSEANINGLYREHVKFLVGVKLSLAFIRKHLDSVYDDVRMAMNFDEGTNTYGYEEAYQKAYTEFFEVKKTPKRGITVTYKEKTIREARKYLGYFALITNEKMDAFTALHLYRMKDVVEKAFGNIKERLNMRRLLVSSERGLDGKIFTEFVALILVSHLDHWMREANLYKQYTLHQLLDKLDVIECFEDPGYALRVGEILNKQKEIYEALNVPIPTSSC